MKLPFGVVFTVLGMFGVASGGSFQDQTGIGVLLRVPSLAGALLLVIGLILVAKRDRLHPAKPQLSSSSPNMETTQLPGLGLESRQNVAAH